MWPDFAKDFFFVLKINLWIIQTKRPIRKSSRLTSGPIQKPGIPPPLAKKKKKKHV
jgi:hypothetical protein